MPSGGAERMARDMVADLERALRKRVDGEVRFDAGSRAAYATDASNFRQVPVGVVVPRTPEAAADAVAVCREHDAPVLSRGGGTSLAGQTTNTAVVLGWSKYCHQVESVDARQRTCVVQPGIVLDRLNENLAPHGLRFGPEPATHMNCTLGGMIGNNSCGATAQRTGKVVDNIAALEVLLYDGTQAAVAVLEDAGWRVDIPAGPVGCGLTWISTGQLAVAKRVLGETVARLAAHVRAGGGRAGRAAVLASRGRR